MSSLSQVLARTPELLRRFARANPLAMRYAVDGLLVLTASNLAANNHSLYALRLGAGEFQLSLIQLLPQSLTLLVLIPGGLLTDTLRGKNRMVMGALAVSALLFLVGGAAPWFGGAGVYFFLAALSLASAALALYNISWQSFFPEAVPAAARNTVYTLRTRVGVFVAMLTPLITGVTLSFIPSTMGKIAGHQVFYIFVAVLFWASLLNFRRIAPILPAILPAAPKKLSLPAVKASVKAVFSNKAFLSFAAVALFFYFTWQIDWTLYYIGQVNYLNMNELQLGLVTVLATAAQFFTLRFWSKKNERHGVVFTMLFGIWGLALCPISMIAAVSLPAFIAPYLFILFNTVSNLAFVTVTLNVYQCLLQVADEDNRSLTFSVFSTFTCLSNAVMPVLGVLLYQQQGGDRDALRRTFWLVFVLRLIAGGLWWLRWRSLERKKN